MRDESLTPGDNTTTRNVHIVPWAICRLPNTQDRLPDMTSFPQLEWTGTRGKIIASDLLMRVLRPPREARLLNRHLRRLLMHEAPDPNVNRLSLLQAIEAGVHQYRRLMPVGKLTESTVTVSGSAP